MKYLLTALLLSFLLSGCGSGSKNKLPPIALCGNGELSKKNSCTEACQGQGGVQEWLVEGCAPPK